MIKNKLPERKEAINLQILAISDTHVGEDSSILTFPHGRQSLWRILRKFFGDPTKKDRDENNGKFNVDELILVGDIPDAALSSRSQIITHTNALIQTLGSAAKVRKCVYIPGNHDHTIWSDYLKMKKKHGEKSDIYSTPPKGDIIVKDNEKDNSLASNDLLSIFFGYPNGSSWRTIVDEKYKKENKFDFVIANPLYATESESRTYVFAHGTHFKSIITKREFVKKIINFFGLDRTLIRWKPDPVPNPKNLERRLAQLKIDLELNQLNTEKVKKKVENLDEKLKKLKEDLFKPYHRITEEEKEELQSLEQKLTRWEAKIIPNYDNLEQRLAQLRNDLELNQLITKKVKKKLENSNQLLEDLSVIKEPNHQITKEEKKKLHSLDRTLTKLGADLIPNPDNLDRMITQLRIELEQNQLNTKKRKKKLEKKLDKLDQMLKQLRIELEQDQLINKKGKKKLDNSNQLLKNLNVIEESNHPITEKQKKKLNSLYRILTKLSQKKIKKLDNLEKNITSFVDSIWASSGNNPTSISDHLFNIFNLFRGNFEFEKRKLFESEKFSYSDLHKLWESKGTIKETRKNRKNKEKDKGKWAENIEEKIKILEEGEGKSLDLFKNHFLYPMLLNLRKNRLLNNPITFVYGDTHDGGYGELEVKIKGSLEKLRVYNCGCWIVHGEKHPPCHIFAVDKDGNEYLLNISFLGQTVLTERLLPLASRDCENRTIIIINVLDSILTHLPKILKKWGGSLQEKLSSFISK